MSDEMRAALERTIVELALAAASAEAEASAAQDAWAAASERASAAARRLDAATARLRQHVASLTPIAQAGRTAAGLPVDPGRRIVSGLAVKRCPHLGVLDRLDGLRCTPCDGPAPVAVPAPRALVVDVCPSCDTPIRATGECGCSD